MGWCSGTEIFDAICDEILDTDKVLDTSILVEKIIELLEDNDWDCQSDSEYWTHPVVKAAMFKLHPDWFEDEDA